MIEWKNTFSPQIYQSQLRDAAKTSLYAMGYHWREFLLKKFNEPKTGKVYPRPRLGRNNFYTASHRTEYPAVRYGIMANSITYELQEPSQGEMRLEFGSAEFAGSTLGIPNVPYWAAILELAVGDSNWRPWLSRSEMDTRASRNNLGIQIFIQRMDRSG